MLMVIFIRGMFGTQKAGGILKNAFDLRKKNVANTNILYWGQKLVALWEGGLPHSMDPISLETIGESTLGGVLGRGETLTAHPRYDPVKARQIFFSADVGPITTKVRLTLDWQTIAGARLKRKCLYMHSTDHNSGIRRSVQAGAAAGGKDEGLLFAARLRSDREVLRLYTGVIVRLRVSVYTSDWLG